jgi:hypothetical protein
VSMMFEIRGEDFMMSWGGQVRLTIAPLADGWAIRHSPAPGARSGHGLRTPADRLSSPKPASD